MSLREESKLWVLLSSWVILLLICLACDYQYQIYKSNEKDPCPFSPPHIPTRRISTLQKLLNKLGIKRRFYGGPGGRHQHGGWIYTQDLIQNQRLHNLGQLWTNLGELATDLYQLGPTWANSEPTLLQQSLSWAQAWHRKH